MAISINTTNSDTTVRPLELTNKQIEDLRPKFPKNTYSAPISTCNCAPIIPPYPQPSPYSQMPYPYMFNSPPQYPPMYQMPYANLGQPVFHMVHSTLNEMPRQPNPFFMPPTNQPNPIQAMALSQQAQHIIPSLPEPEILDRIPPLPPDKIQTQSVHSVTEQKTESANNLIINLKKLEKANELAKTNELN